MRHRVNKSRLSLSMSQRKALISSLARAVMINGRIKTTRERAKNARPLVERLISLGKEGSLSAKRQAYKILQDHLLVSKLFKEIAPKFKNRTGGYSRILLFGRRRGDGTEMALFELSEIIKEKKKEVVRQKKTRAGSTQEQPVVEARIKKIDEAKEKEGAILTEHEKPKTEKPKSAPAIEEKKHKEIDVQAKKKTHKRFLGGLRSIFKKRER